jgi:hypothetical protein
MRAGGGLASHRALNFARRLVGILDLHDQTVEGLAHKLDLDRTLGVVDLPEDSLAVVAEAPNAKEAWDLGTQHAKPRRPPRSMGGALDASHVREWHADAVAKRPEPVDPLEVNGQDVMGDFHGGHGSGPLIGFFAEAFGLQM